MTVLDEVMKRILTLERACIQPAGSPGAGGEGLLPGGCLCYCSGCGHEVLGGPGQIFSGSAGGWDPRVAGAFKGGRCCIRSSTPNTISVHRRNLREVPCKGPSFTKEQATRKRGMNEQARKKYGFLKWSGQQKQQRWLPGRWMGRGDRKRLGQCCRQWYAIHA